MSRVIVTVSRSDDDQERDLEVPADVDVALLTELIVKATGWDRAQRGVSGSYQIEALPLGRMLGNRETLADAGVWDGSRLVFHPTIRQPEEPAVSTGSPGARWRSLGVDLPRGPNVDAQDQAGENGQFQWKRLDDDDNDQPK